MKNYPADHIERVTPESYEKKTLKDSKNKNFYKKPFSKNNILKIV